MHARHGTLPALALAVLVVLASGFFVSAVLRPLVRPYAYSDFATFYSASLAFQRDADPYAHDVLQQTGHEAFPGWIGRYFYPPPFAAVAVRPLTLLPFAAARRVWVGIETVAYLAALLLLARWAGGSVARGLYAAGMIGLPFAPFALDLKLGSVSGVLFLLVMLFLDQRARRREWRAAIALAAAILLKISPVLLLVPLGLHRSERRLGAKVLLVAFGLVVVTLPATGLRAWGDWWTEVTPYLSTAGFSWFTNQSLDAFFYRLFMSNPDTTPWRVAPWLYRSGVFVSSAIVLVAWIRFVVVARRRAGHLTRTAMALTLLASLLLARVTWEYMLVLALPLLALWWMHLARGEVPRMAAAAAGLAAGLILLPIPYTEAPLRHGFGLLLECPRLLGMLGLFALTLRDGVLEPDAGAVPVSATRPGDA